MHERGTIDRLNDEAFAPYRAQGKNIHVWGADELYRFLDLYPEVRTPYLPLLITGDIVAHLMKLVDAPITERATTIDLYIRSALSRETNAQLDQAGDASEDPVPLQSIFFDLDAYISSTTREAIQRHVEAGRSPHLPLTEEDRAAIVRYLISTNMDRAVIVGGPGEGKSTIGQYLAQIHRAALLGNAAQIAISEAYIPELPRIPFRVVLREFAQWLADLSADNLDTGNLDTFISDQVHKVSNRPFSEKDLHEVLKSNPVLLILDGLDEVTDAGVRKRLIVRLLEFIERAQSGLKCDLQTVATTRPTGYNDQFDPRTFVHFRLHKLTDKQVRDYVLKWSIVRKLTEEKAKRLDLTIGECLQDQQISLLMTTPLQVTILILIINSGGTPPRQREALFDEYLEVIYKREKAKGLGIIKSEKELLIGLHKFVAYLLQEESTKAETSSAVFHRPVYDKIVMQYLRENDPYSPNTDVLKEWKAITVDAGERLVLLVESPADSFGFELRSIQEFFAACYLSDTACDTTQRFDRFSTIAYSPHWRNVALFFAGRVGRNYPGEAANVVEACRQMDRVGIDTYIRRGAELALELASERALGPNRILQRSLLEHGIELFDSTLTPRIQRLGTELIRRLPSEDVRDHVIPILERRIPILRMTAKSKVCQLLGVVAPDSNLLETTLIELSSKAGNEFFYQILSIISSEKVSSGLRLRVIESLISAGIEPARIGEYLAHSSWPAICVIAHDLATEEMRPELVRQFASSLVEDAEYLGQVGGFAAVESVGDDSPLENLLCIVMALGVAVTTGSHISSVAGAINSSDLLERLATRLPDAVREGNFSEDSLPEDACWMMWLAHLSLGNVTSASWTRFGDWFSRHQLSEEVKTFWGYSSRMLCPLTDVIARHNSVVELDKSAPILGGLRGSRTWLTRLNDLMLALDRELGERFRRFLFYGPGILSAEELPHIVSLMSSFFDEPLHPIACEWMIDRRRIHPLTVKELDKMTAWFVNLPSESLWRREHIARGIADQAITLGRIASPELQPVLETFSVYALAELASRVATSEKENPNMLAYLIEISNFASQSRIELVTNVRLRFADRESKRVAIIRTLALTDDTDPVLREGASALLVALCGSYAGEEAQPKAFRNPSLDDAQARLISSNNTLERAAGIALYSVRPPRSHKDWQILKGLFETASYEEVSELWMWVLPAAAEVSNRPDLWIKEITGILEGGVESDLLSLLSDVMRILLPQQSQSLTDTARLALPTIERSM